MILVKVFVCIDVDFVSCSLFFFFVVLCGVGIIDIGVLIWLGFCLLYVVRVSSVKVVMVVFVMLRFFVWSSLCFCWCDLYWVCVRLGLGWC